MAKIIEEEKILRYDTVNGKEVPVYSAKTETIITNTLTGDANTATTINDIKRDVVIIAPRLLTGSEMPD